MIDAIDKLILKIDKKIINQTKISAEAYNESIKSLKLVQKDLIKIKNDCLNDCR
jgi:hypothetical protein